MRRLAFARSCALQRIASLRFLAGKDQRKVVYQMLKAEGGVTRLTIRAGSG